MTPAPDRVAFETALDALVQSWEFPQKVRGSTAHMDRRCNARAAVSIIYDALRAERDAAVARAETLQRECEAMYTEKIACDAAIGDIAVETCDLRKENDTLHAEVAALTADNERLRGALAVFVERADWCAKSGDPAQIDAVAIFRERINAARAALAPRETP